MIVDSRPLFYISLCQPTSCDTGSTGKEVLLSVQSRCDEIAYGGILGDRIMSICASVVAAEILL